MALARTNRGTQSLSLAVQATATLVSSSFSPAAGALLVVFFDEYTRDTTPSLTMSSSFTGQGAWTTYSFVSTDDGFGNFFTAYIAVSVCGASPGTGTVTCTRRAGSVSMSMFAEFIEVTGQASTPITQSKTALGTGSSSLANNFTGAPAATSYVFASLIDGGGGTVVVPTGMTGLGGFALDATWSAKHAEKLGSAAQNNTWTGLGAFTDGAVAIEVAEAVATFNKKRFGGLPFAGQQGRW